MAEESDRERYLKRYEALRQVRSSWESHWFEIARFIQPRRSRFFQSEAQTGGRRKHQAIVNNTAGRASRTLAAGLMAGVTSPSRPWFGLTTPDPDLGESSAVKEYLYQCESRLLAAMAKAGIYNNLHQIYKDLTFGTGVALVEEDLRTIARGYSIPPGEYFLAASDRGEVDTLVRITSLTVRQLVAKFEKKGQPMKAVSTRVRDLYRRAQYDDLIEVLHFVEPREDYDPTKADAKNMPWRSCWLEREAAEGLLLESGYRESPILAPRWDVTGNDVYGSGPGMDALGDVKALQLLEKNKATVVDKIADPAMQGPGALRNRSGVSFLPGAMNFNDSPGGAVKMEPIYEVNPASVTVVASAIKDHEERINSEFFADLWLMLSNSDDPQMTAREVAERHEEKMLQLGPVMERLEPELLNPMVTRFFGILSRAGRLPPPPEEMQGQPITAEYRSIMAQAQKAITGNSVQRLVGFVGSAAQFNPEVVDKIDLDEATAQVADALGVSPSVVRSSDQVAKLRAQRQQQQAQQAQAQNALAATQAAKNLGQADAGGGESALSRVVGPVAAAQAGAGEQP